MPVNSPRLSRPLMALSFLLAAIAASTAHAACKIPPRPPPLRPPRPPPVPSGIAIQQDLKTFKQMATVLMVAAHPGRRKHRPHHLSGARPRLSHGLPLRDARRWRPESSGR